MKLSPLQLLEYFVAEFHFSLNSKFDPAKDVEKKLEEMEANPRWDKHADKPRTWTVALDLKYQPAAGTNTPYSFSLTLVGLFEVASSYAESKVELLVRTNGPSVLYSIAREIVREQTARGPDGPLIIPTASFLPDPAASRPNPPATPSASVAESGAASETSPLPAATSRESHPQKTPQTA